MQRLRIHHVTEYVFSGLVTLNQHRLLIRPREGHDVRIESSKLNISPSYQIKWQRDVFDNSLATVSFNQNASRLLIESEVVIQHYEQVSYECRLDEYAENCPFVYALHERIDLAAFQQAVFPHEQYTVNAWLLSLMVYGMQTLNLLLKINQTIKNEFRYQMREEAGVQSPAQTLAQRSGSCRDYATLMIEACRCLGLASRFVSGYLHAPATEAGNASTHAWVEVYLPGMGWKGFDPTAGEMTGNRHIAVAVARDPVSVPPVSGSYIGIGAATMRVDVKVSLL